VFTQRDMMAIDYSQYIYTNANKEAKDLLKGLQADKTFTKYLFIFRAQGKLIRKTFNFSKSTELGKIDLIKKANFEAGKYQREKEAETITAFTLDTKFEKLAEEYI